MAESILRLYKTEITPQRNAWVENISNYLSECGIAFEVNPFQYQKIELDKTLKIAIDQYWSAIGDANYCSIEQDGMDYYYFIISAKWTGTQCVTLSLSIDSVNTFGDMLEWSPKTTIIREHVDRFEDIQPINFGEAMTVSRKIDDVDEGASGLLKIKSSDSKIIDSNSILNQAWYLVYRTPEEPSSTSPVDCFLLPKYDSDVCYKNTTTTTTVTYEVSDFELDYWYYWLYSDNPNGVAKVDVTYTLVENGNYVGLAFHRTSSGLNAYVLLNQTGELPGIKASLIWQNKTGVTVTWTKSNSIRRGADFIADLAYIQRYYTEYSLTAGVAGKEYLKGISAIDRTKSTIVKIIECPYCPINLNFDALGVMVLPTGWRITNDNYLKLSSLTLDFYKTLDNVLSLPLKTSLSFTSKDKMVKIKRNKGYESKLYNSDFYTLKIAYDSFSSEIKLERINTFSSNILSIEYKQSNNITSDCGFKIDCASKLNYKGIGDYDFYILSSRNNESPIYTNAYLDYKRTGAYYDKKNAEVSTGMAWMSAGVALVGAAASAVASVGTGGLSLVATAALTTSAITSIASAINTTASNERGIQQTIDEKKAQASQITGSDDLNLLNWYNGNKLHVVTYSVTDKMKQVLADLFHYCGYARNMQGKPDFSSRYWFNYVQCNAVFVPSASSKIYANFQSDMKTRFAAGVTYYHRRDDEYDWNQEYENWEVGFFS